MRKIKKILVCLAIVSTVLSGVVSINKISNSTVSAANNVFSVEQYTDSDYLLQADGELSTRRIKDFVSDVKNGEEGDYFPELAEVIPRQYLETTADNATFAYNGKEYGFYVVKGRSFFDVLLIDFSYEFPEGDQIHTSDREYVIRIEPILQQSFWREKSGNTYTWKKNSN